MAHFAKVVNGIVTKVIVAEQDFIKTYSDGEAGEWVQTSYNTIGGKHTNKGTPLRKNFAGIGFTYDHTKDAFIPPKPFDSWTLNEDTFLWEPPSPYPDDKKYYEWDEGAKGWQEIDA